MQVHSHVVFSLRIASFRHAYAVGVIGRTLLTASSMHAHSVSCITIPRGTFLSRFEVCIKRAIPISCLSKALSAHAGARTGFGAAFAMECSWEAFGMLGNLDQYVYTMGMSSITVYTVSCMMFSEVSTSNTVLQHV